MRILDKDPIVEEIIRQNKYEDEELGFLEELISRMIESDIKDLASEELIEIITELFKYKMELESIVLCLAPSRIDKMPKNYD